MKSRECLSHIKPCLLPPFASDTYLMELKANRHLSETVNSSARYLPSVPSNAKINHQVTIVYYTKVSTYCSQSSYLAFETELCLQLQLFKYA